MKTVTKIACRTIGALGLGTAVYDAVHVAGHHAKIQSEIQESKYLEKVYYDSRTIDKFSYTSDYVREKAFDKRSKNPLPSLWGKIKGANEGFVHGLGEHLLAVACGSLALVSKGFLAKVGAAGVCISFVHNVLHNGFGLGKTHPMK